MDNMCICCGEIIPEGRQICPKCEKTDMTAAGKTVEDKHWSECGQIARYEDENRKLKGLLRRAVGDIEYLIKTSQSSLMCDKCKYGNEVYCYVDDCSSNAKWEHSDEAKKLLGEDINVPTSVSDTNVDDKGRHGK